jgi:hypothetical protein
MPKVQSWSEEQWKKELASRFDRAKKYREYFEPQWTDNGFSILDSKGDDNQNFSVSFDNVLEVESGEVDVGDSQLGINNAWKNVRFWHSQMSANPPSVTVRPRSSDPGDGRKADAADRISRWLHKNLDMSEVADQQNHNMLIYGMGYNKIVWDPDRGDVFDFNEETSDVVMTGDHCNYSPAVDDVWLDPDARRKQDVRWMIERMRMPMEEAVFKWPEHAKAIMEHEGVHGIDATSLVKDDTSNHLGEKLVEIYEYYEKASPINGMAGRRAVFLSDGTPLTYGKNPHYKARLPIKILTYVDVPNQVYGKSVVEYVVRIQQMLNRLDSSILDNIQAHGVVRMAIHESSEIEDEAISNSAWDYIKYGGSSPPHFVPAPQMMPDIWKFRDALVQAVQDLFGINDSMLGIQKREQSAVSQQTSIESGTMVHRRLMKKYASCVEEVYQDALGLVKENWTTPRQVLVLGKEKAFEAADFSGADISGGFDLDVEYGTSLPLDPNLAREQLMLMMPALKEAGMSMKDIMKRFRLSELEGALDIMDMAADRQREVFEEMIASAGEGEPLYIAPKELQEHQGMLEYAYVYIMTAEYKYLDDDTKLLIEKHIKDRETLAAQGAAAQPQPGAGPGVEQLPGSPGVSGALPPAVALPQQ